MAPWLILLAANLLLAESLAAAPAPVSAKVILVRGPHVYLALRDSLTLGAGDRVMFRRRKDELAGGRVIRTLAGELAVVQIESGSLSTVKAKHLDHIEVLLAERTKVVSLARLRLGYPSAARSNLLFACDRVGVQLPAAAYRAVDSTARSVRWVRDKAVALAAPWPDTLVMRFFDDAADQEIALERGEIDVAVFWPGELSRHMREQSRWQVPIDEPGLAPRVFSGRRSRGYVAAFPTDSSLFIPYPTTLTQLNRELFRGDLLPAYSGNGTLLPPVRYEVDQACPGWREMQRFLDRYAPVTTRRARLVFIDEPVSSMDSVRHGSPVFLLGCPVVSAPQLRPYLMDLDLVNALDCSVRGRKP